MDNKWSESIAEQQKVTSEQTRVDQLYIYYNVISPYSSHFLIISALQKNPITSAAYFSSAIVVGYWPDT
jgi:hypothetical protein